MSRLVRGLAALGLSGLLTTWSLPAGELAGHKLLVISLRTGDTEVFVVDPDTGDALNLSRSPGSSERYPSWSPDGRQVAFTSDRDGTYNLFLVDADGTHLRQLTRCRRC